MYYIFNKYKHIILISLKTKYVNDGKELYMYILDGPMSFLIFGWKWEYSPKTHLFFI